VSDQNFWSCIEGLSTTLDGGREAAERHLDSLERDLMAMSPNERNQMRRRMIMIVAQLSRLEVRVSESQGSLRGTI
jgi:hypothetical protein